MAAYYSGGNTESLSSRQRCDAVISFIDGKFRPSPLPSCDEQLFYNRCVAAALALSHRVAVLACSQYQFVYGYFALGVPYRGAQHDLILYELYHVQDIMQYIQSLCLLFVTLMECSVVVHGLGTCVPLRGRCLGDTRMAPGAAVFTNAGVSQGSGSPKCNKHMCSIRSVVEWLSMN